MRRVIDVRDIRRGDLIRAERDGSGAIYTAVEYVATEDEHLGVAEGEGQHYLLDRPSPSVELPTEPTLGWASWSPKPAAFFNSGQGEAVLGFFQVVSESHEPARWGFRRLMNAGIGSISPDRITAFTPATAVPTEALDVLREFQANSEHSRLIGDFLAAVDEANGTAS